jgi:hypothetical protein
MIERLPEMQARPFLDKYDSSNMANTTFTFIHNTSVYLLTHHA